MALVSQGIPSLYNGVSQQSPALRLPSQCEVQENALSRIVDGISKRPPTEHLAKLSATISDDSFIHIINRDTTERYVVVVSGGSSPTLKVFDFAGNEKTVNASSGYSYLATTSPLSDLVAVSVADYTFFSNRSKKVAMSSTTASSGINAAVVWIERSVAGTKYEVVIDGTNVVTAEVPVDGASFMDTDDIAGNLVAQINGADSYPGVTGFTAIQRGSILRVKKDDGSDFDIYCRDGWGNQGSSCFKNTVQSFAKLPPRFFPDIYLEVTGNDDNSFGSFYVHWVPNGSSENSTGSWEEVPQPGLKTTFNASTMPHQLVRESDGTFTFGPATWNTRSAGDEDTAPTPTFVGKSIRDVFFHRNRLGFLSDENVILSRAGDFFNFWPSTATDVLDDDPIDAGVSATKVSILHHAVPYQKNLIVFSDQTQFLVEGGDILTPKSISVTVTTEFEASTKVRPVTAGANAYFATESQNRCSIYEYFVDPDSLTNDAANVTGHVPSYIPPNVIRLAASSNEDTLLVLSEDDRETLYVYRFYWDGNKKAQSSWSKWTFGDSILDMAFIQSTLYLLINREDGLYLETMNLEPYQTDTGLTFKIHLDRRVDVTGVYSSGTDLTTFTLPFDESGDVQIVTSGGFASNPGVALNITRTGADTFTAVGDWTESTVVAGRSYTMRYGFSRQYLRDGNGFAIQSGKLTLRSLLLSFTDTGAFRVEATPQGRDTFTQEYTSRVLGTSSFVLGKPTMASNELKTLILMPTPGMQLEIVNDTYLPSTFQAAEWEGFWTQRSQRL